MNAVYRIPNILFSWDYEREREHTRGRYTVMEPEHPAVYVYMGYME